MQYEDWQHWDQHQVLAHDHGRRFLVHALGLNEALTVDIHDTIKAQLPGGRRAAAVAYGELASRDRGASEAAGGRSNATRADATAR